jgi:hypothetical protein
LSFRLERKRNGEIFAAGNGRNVVKSALEKATKVARFLDNARNDKVKKYVPYSFAALKDDGTGH